MGVRERLHREAALCKELRRECMVQAERPASGRARRKPARGEIAGIKENLRKGDVWKSWGRRQWPIIGLKEFEFVLN